MPSSVYSIGILFIFPPFVPSDVDSKTNIAASNYAKRKKKCEVFAAKSLRGV